MRLLWCTDELEYTVEMTNIKKACHCARGVKELEGIVELGGVRLDTHLHRRFHWFSHKTRSLGMSCGDELMTFSV